jgi:hypothetical protein
VGAPLGEIANSFPEGVKVKEDEPLTILSDPRPSSCLSLRIKIHNNPRPAYPVAFRHDPSGAASDKKNPAGIAATYSYPEA